MFRAVFALTLIPMFYAETSQAAERVGLVQALKIAIENAPNLSSVRAELTIRDLEYKNSYSVFLPSLDLSTTVGYRGSQPEIYSSPFSSELNLFLTENLYDNGAAITNWRSAKLRRQIADLNFRSERDRISLEVAQEFMRFSLASALLEVQTRQFQIVNQQFRTVESQFRQGVKTRRDYLKFKTEVRRTEIEVQSATATVEKSRLELMRLLGYDAKDTASFDFVPEVFDANLVKNIPQAKPDVGRHFRYQIAERQREVYENDVQLVRRRLWPELFVTAGAVHHRGDYLNTGIVVPQSNVTSWNVLLNLKFNFLDWGIRSRNVSIAEERRTQGELNLRENLNTFSSENSKLMEDLRVSANNYALARELIDLETSSYTYLEGDYRNGRVTYLDIVVSLRDLLRAKIQLQSSYFDLRVQLLKYRFYEGKLYESLFEN